jgi:hypothetical protein
VCCSTEPRIGTHPAPAARFAAVTGECTDRIDQTGHRPCHPEPDLMGDRSCRHTRPAARRRCDERERVTGADVHDDTSEPPREQPHTAAELVIAAGGKPPTRSRRRTRGRRGAHPWTREAQSVMAEVPLRRCHCSSPGVRGHHLPPRVPVAAERDGTGRTGR